MKVDDLPADVVIHPPARLHEWGFAEMTLATWARLPKYECSTPTGPSHGTVYGRTLFEGREIVDRVLYVVKDNDVDDKGGQYHWPHLVDLTDD